MNSDITLDSYDRALLRALQRDNTTPLRLLAEEVHLSTASVQRRVQRMRQAGVICANEAIVSPEKVGQGITILVEVQALRTQTQDLDALKKAFSGPDIQQCYYVTGDADFMLVLTVRGMAEYEALARRLFYDNPSVKWFRTVVVMDRVKVSLNIPVD